MRATKPIDYASIRNDFVYGEKNEAGVLAFPTCELLARKYGATGQTIRRKCNKEKWRDLREVTKLEVAAMADVAIREKMAGELVKVDMLAFTVAMKGLQKTQKGLDEVADKDARSINCLAVAARVFQDIAHKAAGKGGKGFAAVLKIERRLSVQDEKVQVEEIVQGIMKLATDDNHVDRIISALDKAEEGGL